MSTRNAHHYYLVPVGSRDEVVRAVVTFQAFNWLCRSYQSRCAAAQVRVHAVLELSHGQVAWLLCCRQLQSAALAVQLSAHKTSDTRDSYLVTGSETRFYTFDGAKGHKRQFLCDTACCLSADATIEQGATIACAFFGRCRIDWQSPGMRRLVANGVTTILGAQQDERIRLGRARIRTEMRRLLDEAEEGEEAERAVATRSSVPTAALWPVHDEALPRIAMQPLDVYMRSFYSLFVDGKGCVQEVLMPNRAVLPLLIPTLQPDCVARASA